MLVLLGFDLLLSTKIRSIASNVGRESLKAKDIHEAESILKEDPEAMLLINLGSQLSKDIVQLTSPNQTIGVYSHVDTEASSLGERLGVSVLWTRSVLEKNLARVLSHQA